MEIDVLENKIKNLLKLVFILTSDGGLINKDYAYIKEKWDMYVGIPFESFKYSKVESQIVDMWKERWSITEDYYEGIFPLLELLGKIRFNINLKDPKGDEVIYIYDLFQDLININDVNSDYNSFGIHFNTNRLLEEFIIKQKRSLNLILSINF